MVEQDIPQEHLSEEEARFDQWRRRIGLFAGPIIAIVLYLLPLPLNPDAHKMAAIMAGTIIYWMTEPIPIPITAMLAPMLAILFGLSTAKELLASFGHPLVFLFIGSFLIARAMQVSGLDRHVALTLLSLPGLGGSPYTLLWTLGGITAFLSMWISNTAATAIMFPIALGILGDLRSENGATLPQSYRTGTMLMIAFAASVGGLGTPIGTPPNLIGIGMIEEQIGQTISFFDWMMMALPFVIVMYFALYFLIVALHGSPQLALFKIGDFIQTKKNEIGPWTTAQRNTLFVFCVAVFFWIVPGFLGVWFGAGSEQALRYEARMPEGVVAILAASLLFFLPTDWKKQAFTLSLQDALEIDWGTILLFGGGLAMGELIYKTGLSEAVGNGFFERFGMQSLWGITALAIALAIITSELSSNTASAAMVIPIVIAIAQNGGVNPIPPILGATIGASYGFMLPISTPPNSIVYGSGMIPIRKMMATGILFDIIGFFVILLGIRVMAPLLGWV